MKINENYFIRICNGIQIKLFHGENNVCKKSIQILLSLKKYFFLGGLILLTAVTCSSTKQLDIYNPFPDKDISIERKNVGCSDAIETKLWYVLYGNYPINHINVRELFPSPDYSYKIEQVTTTGDKILSVIGGLFLSVSRKTLIIETCQPVTGDISTEEEGEVPSTPVTFADDKIGALEKEVSFLKGKISGIESTVNWINQPQADQSKVAESSSRSVVSPENIETKRQNLAHMFFLFNRGSDRISKEDNLKLKSLKSSFENARSKFLIVGSADKTGDFKFNLGLSWARALSVKNALIEIGVEPDRILISGAGNAVDKESTKLVPKLARRVDIYLVDGAK